MLRGLSVRNIVLIDQLDLNLEEGLIVLTGETGAGKSILLDALTLALGGRGDQSLVRKGVDSGQVAAEFSVPVDHPARQLLRDNDIADDDELILRRIQFKDGRTRALVNDQPISANLMRKLGLLLVEIHGQHDDRALVDGAAHRGLLDAFAGLETQAQRVAERFEQLADLQAAFQAQLEKVNRAGEEEEYARHAVEELEQMNPGQGEEESLADRRQYLMQLEKAADEVADADEILSGPSAPELALATLLRRLQRKNEREEQLFAPLVESLNESLDAVGRAQEALSAIKRELDFEPRELNDVEERLFGLRAMARKHDTTCDGLIGVLENYKTELELLQNGEAELNRLKVEVENSEKSYRALAEKLSAARAKAAKELARSVEKELPDLKLAAASFIVDQQVDKSRVAASGFDQIAFHVQTNPGTSPGPIMKVASGGELSRFLLALKVVLADRGSAPVLIFDEIDTGVGGAVADAMGRRLAKLAKNVQVLAVTHAPQVAARADRHMLIEKQVVDEGTFVRTHVRALDEGARGEEVARMLAGAQVTDEARAAAKRLLSEVG